MLKLRTTGAVLGAGVLHFAIVGCGAFGDDLEEVKATVENCGAGGLSETIVRLENPNDEAVTAVLDIGVYDDSTGDELVQVEVLKSVPAKSTAEARKNISLGVRAFISCKVVKVDTRPKLGGVK